MPGRPETERERVQRFGEQGQELDRSHQQRDIGTEASGRHAHLADDHPEQHSGRSRPVPGFLERQEPVAETVYDVAHLRRADQERGVAGVRVLFRRVANGGDGPVAGATDSRYGILDGHVHGSVFLHRGHQHGKRETAKRFFATKKNIFKITYIIYIIAQVLSYNCTLTVITKLKVKYN